VTKLQPESTRLIGDGHWLPHRYDAAADAVQFRLFEREDHRRATFLSAEEVGDGPTVALPRTECLAAVKAMALPPVRLILHSAFCCSTLLTRAFDLPGMAMGLSEPMILNDVVGLRLRGGDPRQVAAALDVALHLLARPLAAGEAMVIKPSNLFNPLAPVAIKLQPELRLLLLHAPLEDYLGSVARKEIEGRAWVRELMWKLIGLGEAARFGLSEEELYRQTDLQVAALGWLAQQARFEELALQLPERVRVVDSVTLMRSPRQVMAELAKHFSVDLDAGAVASGPAFTRHSKDGRAFDAAARDAERSEGLARHAREVTTVAEWAGRVAEFAHVSMILPGPLVG
jgi:hypothetical protein